MPQKVLDTCVASSAVDPAGTRSYPNVTANTGGAPSYPYSSKLGPLRIATSGFIKQNFSSGGEGCLVYGNAPCAPDMWAKATFTNAGDAGAYMGVNIGMDPTTADQTGVEIRWQPTGVNAGGWSLNKFVNGTPTTLGSLTGQTLITGNTYVMDIQSSGLQIVVAINGNVILSETMSAVLTSSQIYAGLTIYYTGTSASTFSNFTAGTFDMVVETLVDGNRVSWDSRLFASTYTVQSSSTSGGTYTTIGTVTAGSPTSFFDPTPGVHYYKVIPNYTNPSSGSGATQGPVASLSAPLNFNVPASTIIGGNQLTRQNLITDGTNYWTPDPTKLIFTEIQSQAVPPSANGYQSAPYSTSVIAIENMTGTTGFTGGMAAVGSAVGTSTWTGRQFKFSCTAGAGMQAFRNPALLLAGWFGAGFSVDPGFTGRVTWGIGADANNGVFASFYYDGSAYHFKVFGVTTGTRTAIVADATFSGPTTTAAFEIAAEFARYCFSAWSNTNGTWNSLNMVANATIGGAYDLYNATSLANWSPMLLVGSDTGDSEAAAITMNEFRMTYTQGNGKLRESAFVHFFDGSLYQQDGLNVVGFDRCVRVPGSLGVDAILNVHCLHLYDPITSKLQGQPFCQLFGTFSGPPTSVQDSQGLYDPTLNSNAGGFHVFSPDWGAGSTGQYTGMWHATTQSIVGPQLLTFTLISQPSALTSAGLRLYGGDVFYCNGTWYMLATAANLGTSPSQTVVVSGSSPTSMTTLVAYDGSALGSPATVCEGTNWVFMGSRIFAIAGTLTDDGANLQGPIVAWDFSDLATLEVLGPLQYVYPQTQTVLSIPAQPSIVASSASANSAFQLQTMDDNSGGAGSDMGNVFTYSADKTLVGTQWPVRASQNLIVPIIPSIGGVSSMTL
jgi:hypothetical protein